MRRLSLRPEIHMPWPALAVFAALMYVVRSWLRGWDFVPDLTDIVIFGSFAAILVLRAFVRSTTGDDTQDPDGDL